MTELDIEAIAEIAARTVLKVMAEQAKAPPKPEPLGWQSLAVTVKTLGLNQTAIGRARRKSILRMNVDYKLAPQPRGVQKPRFVYHVENCAKKLGVGK